MFQSQLSHPFPNLTGFYHTLQTVESRPGVTLPTIFTDTKEIQVVPGCFLSWKGLLCQWTAAPYVTQLWFFAHSKVYSSFLDWIVLSAD